MLSKQILEALNQQIVLEAYASFLYLSMASWCEQKGLEGSAKFMHRQSNEEREHMLRIFHYINERDGHALAPQVKQAPHDFDSAVALFEMVYAHEKKVTASINKIVGLCYKEDDYTTLHFLQWYIEEQREEEALMSSILDKINLIGDGPQSLYYIDKEIEKINAVEEKAEQEAEPKE